MLGACTQEELVKSKTEVVETYAPNTTLRVNTRSSSLDKPSRLFSYNLTQKQSAILDYYSEDVYSGDAYILPGDEVICLSPATDYSVTNSMVNLSMPNNDGYSAIPYLWGHSKVADTNNITSIQVSLYDLTSTCLFHIVNDDNAAVGLKSFEIRPTKGMIYQSRDLNLLTGTWEKGTRADFISIASKTGFADGNVTVSLIPTSAELSITIVDLGGNTYESVLPQTIFEEGKTKSFDIKCHQPEPVSEYVEVCGTKWAKGNLLYASDEEGADGFQSHWRLAYEQWQYFNMVYGTGGTSISVDLPYDTEHVHLFNWGTCGANALDVTKYGTRPNTDIAGKMYLDKYLSKETTDFNQALYGDIAYWASNGKWRMATYDEFYNLYSVASYRCGYYKTDDGQLVFGILFTTPEGERITDTSFQYFTKEQLDEGLFLPGAGYRQQAVEIIKRVGKSGFYWNSYRPESANQLNLRFINTTLYWSGDGATYGRSIRPVLNQ